MKHTCHAMRCSREVAPRFMMCPTHWRKVPRRLQAEVYRAYVPGQEQRKDPSADYLRVAERAIVSVATAEGHLTTEEGVRRIAQADARAERMAELFVEYGRLL